MKIWSKISKFARPRMRNEIDWKEMGRDLRTECGKSALAYRTMMHFW